MLQSGFTPVLLQRSAVAEQRACSGRARQDLANRWHGPEPVMYRRRYRRRRGHTASSHAAAATPAGKPAPAAGDRAPPGIDATVPTAARIYDYLAGRPRQLRRRPDRSAESSRAHARGSGSGAGQQGVPRPGRAVPGRGGRDPAVPRPGHRPAHQGQRAPGRPGHHTGRARGLRRGLCTRERESWRPAIESSNRLLLRRYVPLISRAT
jgi:hypothetical protein